MPFIFPIDTRVRNCFSQKCAHGYGRREDALEVCDNSSNVPEAKALDLRNNKALDSINILAKLFVLPIQAGCAIEALPGRHRYQND